MRPMPLEELRDKFGECRSLVDAMPRVVRCHLLIVVLLAMASWAPQVSADVGPRGTRAAEAGRPSVLSGAEASRSPLCAVRTCVHWTDEGEDAPPTRDDDGDGLFNYVEDISAFAEDSLERQTGQGPDGLGWPQPVADGSLGGEVDKTDLYVDRGSGGGGYAVFDPGHDHRRSGYAAISNLFRDPARLRGVVTHELNHVLQFGTDAYAQLWMFEATAEWAAQRLHPGYLSDDVFVRDWAAQTEVPLIGPSTKRYGSRVWNEWLASRYGARIVAEAWKGSAATDPRRLSAPAYEAAIGRAGGFQDEFARFAAAVAEWRTSRGVFADLDTLPDAERVGSLAPGAKATLMLDHTTFALLDVPLPVSGPVELRVETPQGIAGAVALVGRTGERDTGEVAVALTPLPEGGAGSVRVADPSGLSRLTAVVVNADAQAASGSGSAAAWRDDQPFDVQRVAPPNEPAPPPTVIEPAPPVPKAEPLPVGPVAHLPPALRRLTLTLTSARRIRLSTLSTRGLLVSLQTNRPSRGSCSATIDGQRVARSAVQTRLGIIRARLRLSASARRAIARRRAARLTVTCSVRAGMTRRTARRVVTVR
jgi:hypothetical protein